MHLLVKLLLPFICLLFLAAAAQAETKDERVIYRPFRAKAESIQVNIQLPDGTEKKVEAQKKFAYRVFNDGGLDLANLGSGAGVGEHKVDRSIGFFRGLHYVVKDNNFDAFISLWDTESQKKVRKYFDENTEEWVQLVAYHGSCKSFKLTETYGIGDYSLARTLCIAGDNKTEKWITAKRETSGEYHLSLEIQGHPVFEAIRAENHSMDIYKPCSIPKNINQNLK